MSSRQSRTGITGAIAGFAVAVALWPATAQAAPVAELTPPSHAFGEQVVDTESDSFDFTLANTGDGAVTVVSVTKAGDNPGQFKLKAGTTCDPGVMLADPDPTCRVRVSFDPGSIGVKDATIEVVTDLSPVPLSVTVSGTSVTAPVDGPAAGVSSVAVPFDSRLIGEGPSDPRTVVLTSVGSAPLAVGAVTVTGADVTQFTVDGAACQNRSLAPKETCAVTVAFDPDSPGPKAAAISIATDAASGPTIVALAGTGVAPPAPPRPGLLKIGKVLPRVTGRSLSVPVTCDPGDGTACAGSLKLTAKGSALGRKGKARSRWFPVGGRSVSLGAGEGRVRVKLKASAAQALRARGRLPLRVTMRLERLDGSMGAARTVNRVVKPKRSRPGRRG